MGQFALSINGTRQTVDAEDDTPLLWILRDELELKGSKLGCGMGICGACTVHVDGKPTRSCVTPLNSVASGKITTIEGIAERAEGRRLQEAWVELDVPQCGYCQAGQIMSAAALIAQTPKPTDAQIDSAMNGNLCRCATYTRIKRAIKKACDLPYEQDA
jgi:isoquinoline 1-oxidoreductase alpha subunit